jgi:hypothetical protein
VNEATLAQWGLSRQKQTNQPYKSTNHGVNKYEIFPILSLFSLMLAKYSPHKLVFGVSCTMFTVMYDMTVIAGRFSQVHTVASVNISLGVPSFTSTKYAVLSTAC